MNSNIYILVLFNNPMKIGITGKLGSGKDTVADKITEKGFIHISLSDILREDLKRQGLPVTRQNLVEIGVKIRTEFGGAILAERAYAKVEENKNYVFTSIGRTEEVEFLKNKGFKIVFVDAPLKVRYERAKKRLREQEPIKFSEFKKLDNIESKGKNLERNFDEIKKKSDIILLNNSTLNVLYKKIEKITKYERPSWDEYFIKMIEAVGVRATCGRGRAGSIITKNNHILATGYVGAPPGLPHCDDVGHLMIKTLHPDGVEREHCIRTTHAEQNAIAQAAKHGVSLDGATIYIKMEPCFSCAKQIISVGIKKVVCARKYQAGQETRKMFKKAGVQLITLEDKEQDYEKHK
jgi:dCMP deaminase